MSSRDLRAKAAAGVTQSHKTELQTAELAAEPTRCALHPLHKAPRAVVLGAASPDLRVGTAGSTA